MSSATELRDAIAAFAASKERLLRARDGVRSLSLSFDPSQPRAENGEWGAGGGGGGSSHPTHGDGESQKPRVTKPALSPAERKDFISKEKDALKSALESHAKNPTPESLESLRQARDTLKERRATAGSSDPNDRGRLTNERLVERRIAHEDSELEQMPRGQARAKKAEDFFHRNTSDKALAAKVAEADHDYEAMAEGDFWSRKGEFRENKWNKHVGGMAFGEDVDREVDELRERLHDSGAAAGERNSIIKGAKDELKKRKAAALERKLPAEALDKAKAHHVSQYGPFKMMDGQPDPKAPALSSQGATANTSTTSPVQMTSLTTGHSASIIAAVLAGRSVDPAS